VASKSRFGLFNQPPPLAIGDDSPYRNKKSNHRIIQFLKARTGSPLPNPATYWQDRTVQELIKRASSSRLQAYTLETFIWIHKKLTPNIISNFIPVLKFMSWSLSLQADGILSNSELMQSENTL
jgi:hypothetical protein